MNFAEAVSKTASEKGASCMDDFDVQSKDRELDALLSEVKGLLGEDDFLHQKTGNSQKTASLYIFPFIGYPMK